jgi:hypothetical protein
MKKFIEEESEWKVKQKKLKKLRCLSLEH